MTVLAGTRDGLYRLEGTRLIGGEVAALHGDGQAVWAVVDGNQLWRGDARGGFGLVTAAPMALRSLVTADGELFVGTAAARLLRLDGDHFDEVEGFGDVPGRDEWHTPWGGPPDTRSLAAAPDGTLFANVHVGGVPRSQDGGDTWVPTIDIHADVHQVIVAATGTVACAAASGLAVSDDAGATWRWRSNGLHARYARALAVAGDAVLVSVAAGPFGGPAALYRSPLHADEPFVRCRAGLPEWFSGIVDTHCLVADGPWAAAADGGTVYVTEDGGATWGVLAEGLPEVRCLTNV